MTFSTLLENNTNLFTVHKFFKFRCGDLNGGHVIGNINTNYDCFISAEMSGISKNLVDFIKINTQNNCDLYAFDVNLKDFPYNLNELFDKYNNIFLKMDIEGREWKWLLSVNHEKLNKISQIVIEFHGLTNTSWHNITINSFCSYDEKIECLKKLEKTHYLIHAHGNNADRVAHNGMPNVMELTYVNKRFFDKEPELNTIPLPMKGLDFPIEKRCADVNLNFYPFVNIDIQKLENPFLIDIPDKEEYNMEDYINIQKQLNSKNITTILENLYDGNRNRFYGFDDFKKRVSRGVNQQLINTHDNLLPTKHLYKIGNGGNHRNCIVCCTPMSHVINNVNDNTRYSSSQQILSSLEAVGFNGHFYLLNGGFPNPTGTEMKYAGVPYCFKIFMMLEAAKLGFDKIIWVDSGCYALNNPEALFNILDNNDVLFNTVEKNDYNSMVLRQTNDLLDQITNTNLISASYVMTIVFGLNLSSVNIKNLIKEYYDMVKIGWPFFSIFPEEIVFSALFNKPDYKVLINNTTKHNKLQIHEKHMSEEVARNNGYYFHHKDYSKHKKQYYITFDNSIGGRFGNQLFRYLTSKLFTIQFNHKYVPINEFTCNDFKVVNDDNIYDFLENKDNISGNNIILRGYYQKSDLFVKHKLQLMQTIFDTNNNDYWQSDNNTIYVKDYIINSKHYVNLNNDDIVVSLRLDDFIQLPCKTSDIIPPQYYIDTLNSLNIKNQKVYIVCDKIRHEWEKKYIEYFKKWNPILIQDTLMNDIALMRDCKTLLHSNSSLCWIISFLSDKNKRVIPCLPKIYMNQNQKLDKIEEKDILKCVTALDHDEVYNLDANEESIFPLSFCVPDECVVDSIPEKKYLLASLIPGDLSTFKFDKYKEKEYNEMYRESRFAITKMKGGWDCLRHYEILMNGCVPLFENLRECPYYTLTTYPKELNDKAYELFNNWVENEECIDKYNALCSQMLEHTRNFCTTSYTAKYFLNNIKNGDKVKNILLITCHHGVNYNRETLWIGLKRYIKSINGVAVEYDKMPFLYNDFDNFSNHKYYTNNCYTFPKRLEKDKDYDMTESEIIEKINNNFWDLIIYGKVGPDEFCTFPLFDIVKTRYNKNKIAFIFGGDEIFNLKNTDKNSYHINMFGVPIYYHPYAEYLNNCKQLARCFVRELDK